MKRSISILFAFIHCKNCERRKVEADQKIERKQNNHAQYIKTEV